MLNLMVVVVMLPVFLIIFGAVFVFALFVSLRWMLMFVHNHNVVKSNIETVSYDIFFL